MATVESGIEVRHLEVEPLTSEAFAPFGDVLSVEGRERLPINLYPGVDVFRADFHTNRPMEWLLTRNDVRDFSVLYLERHMELTQAFISLGGNPFVQVVAAPDARLENGVPAFEEVRAFMVPGDVATNMHPGTWHEPPFGLIDGQVFLYTSHADLTEGLGASTDAKGSIGEKDVDKRSIKEYGGYELRIALPRVGS
tara:strand:+ start:78 stop:665 length:588 start_codon:yes stop_codon:yes gene_type:complete